MCIRDRAIDEGSFNGVPDIALENLILPPSDCTLGSSPIKVTVKNLGTGPINGFSLYYELEDEDIKVTQDFTEVIAPDASLDVTFATPVDFSSVDQGYNIKVVDVYKRQSELRLRRVTAPLFVLKGMGINDDLNGVERPVSFPIKDLEDAQAEVVHSLAKWKRLTLADYHIEPGYGIYTDMNAIRSDEELGNLHSLYVDQWDWERVMTAEERNVEFLKEIVNRIYAAMIRTEYMVYEMYPQIKPCLPQKLHFIHAEELRQLYPTLEPKCREHAICQKYGAVFIIGIGCKLGDGKKHD